MATRRIAPNGACTTLQHLPNTKYWGYALQLNVYRHILETQYGKTVIGLFLVGLHPDLDGYQLEDVPMLRQETEEVFAMRKEAVDAASTSSTTAASTAA